MSPPRRPKALKVDFGLFPTYALAGRAFGPSVPRMVGWAILAHLSAFIVCALPLVIGALLYRANEAAEVVQRMAAPESTLGMLGAGLIVAAFLTFWLLNNFLLLPAGCAVYADAEIRGEKQGAWSALQDTTRSVLVNAGELFVVFMTYLVLCALILLPALLVGYLVLQAGSKVAAFLLISAFLAPGLLCLAVRLGLAVPIVLLEKRSAFEALGRSWELSGIRPWQIAGLIGSWTLVYGLISGVFALFGSQVLTLLVGAFLELFWPALLVAIYHGLLAEEQGVLGRN